MRLCLIAPDSDNTTEASDGLQVFCLGVFRRVTGGDHLSASKSVVLSESGAFKQRRTLSNSVK